MSERIDARQFHEADRAGDWRLFPEGAYAFFRTRSFAASVRLVEAIGRLASGGGAPDVDIRGDGVTVLLRAFNARRMALRRRTSSLPQPSRRPPPIWGSRRSRRTSRAC